MGIGGTEVIIIVLISYVWIHFFIVQKKRSWKERSKYERILTLLSVFFLILFGINITNPYPLMKIIGIISLLLSLRIIYKIFRP